MKTERTYFARWIPVPGKPTIGDWVDDPDLKEITHIDFLPKEEMNPLTKRVCLYICCSDVKVGDTVFLVLQSADNREAHFKVLEVLYGDSKAGVAIIEYKNKDNAPLIIELPLNGLHTIIGQVSDQAKWCYKSDFNYDFKADELRIRLMLARHSTSLYFDLQEMDHIDKAYRHASNIIVEVMCPCCGTFK